MEGAAKPKKKAAEGISIAAQADPGPEARKAKPSTRKRRKV
jgi:hypothetical protein